MASGAGAERQPGTYPSWWFSRSVIAQKSPTNSTPSWPTNYPTSDDYMGINQGQLKNLATAAYNELRFGGRRDAATRMLRALEQMRQL